MSKHRIYVCPNCCERTLHFVDVPRAEWLRHKYRENAEYRERHLQAKRKTPACHPVQKHHDQPPNRTAAATK